MSALKLYQYWVTIMVREPTLYRGPRGAALTPHVLVERAPNTMQAVQEALFRLSEVLPAGHRVECIQHIEKHAEDYRPGWRDLCVKECNRRFGFPEARRGS